MKENIFIISELRNREDSLDYIKILYGFASIFYKDTTILERAKIKALSKILTPSDKAFILLLIIVNFEDYADTNYVESYVGIHFVLCSGWKEDGIHLWSILYQGVKKYWTEHGECFDLEFCNYYTDTISKEK